MSKKAVIIGSGFSGLLCASFTSREGGDVRKIKWVHASNILRERIRIPDLQKVLILARAGVKNQLKLL